VLAKLDLHSRGEAVAFAYRTGLVGDVSAHSLDQEGFLVPPCPAEDIALVAAPADEVTARA